MLSGALVALSYIATTTALAEGAGVAFQLALGIGFATGLVIHFALQRFFVWIHHEEFALPLHGQLMRYLVVAALQYAVTASVTAMLPQLLGAPVTAVYLVTLVIVSTANFLILRGRVFHTTTGRP